MASDSIKHYNTCSIIYIMANYILSLGGCAARKLEEMILINTWLLDGTRWVAKNFQRRQKH